MRVIAGIARSMPLKTPEGLDTRPTTDRIKETLFNILQGDIANCVFVDLFSGSGGIGIEALSRGAKSAVLVDSSAASIKAAKSNIEICGFSDKAKTFQLDYSAFCAMCRDTFDIAFLDPPYNEGLLMPAIKSVLPNQTTSEMPFTSLNFNLLICKMGIYNYHLLHRFVVRS